MSAPAAPIVAIVDDNELHCRALGRVVRQAGFHALAFQSAEDFLAAPQRVCFKCLLLDINLGGMSGVTLHRRLLAQGERIPVIYITARRDAAARSEALSIGCAGFFLKTDATSAIIEALHRATSTF